MTMEVTKTVVVIRDERFTLWLNADGRPVEKLLSEMTSGEVIVAVKWHLAEAERLSRETGKWGAVAEGLAKGVVPTLTEAEIEELPAAAEKMRASGRAAEKAARLLELVRANMPAAWQDARSLDKAIRRYWPSRRGLGL